jgi:hypothetical protein
MPLSKTSPSLPAPTVRRARRVDNTPVCAAPTRDGVPLACARSRELGCCVFVVCCRPVARCSPQRCPAAQHDQLELPPRGVPSLPVSSCRTRQFAFRSGMGVRPYCCEPTPPGYAYSSPHRASALVRAGCVRLLIAFLEVCREMTLYYEVWCSVAPCLVKG